MANLFLKLFRQRRRASRVDEEPIRGELYSLERLEQFAAFLASDDSSYVDGQLLSVDGGVSSTHPYGRIALPS